MTGRTLRHCSICDGWYAGGSYGQHRTSHAADQHRPGHGQARQNNERNAEIGQRVAAGSETLEEIAADYGITRERVRQLAERDGIRRDGVKVPARPRTGSTSRCGRCGQRYPVGTGRAHAVAMDHPYARGVLRPTQVTAMRRAYEAGLGYHLIGKTLGIGFMAVKYHVLQLGLDRHPVGQYPRDSAYRAALLDELREAA